MQDMLLKFAMKHAENRKKLSDLIRTTRSDREYPWPAGKAPWAEAMGGSGFMSTKFFTLCAFRNKRLQFFKKKLVCFYRLFSFNQN